MAWGKAGSTTLSSSGDALTTPTLSSNTSLQYLYHGLPTGGEVTEYMTLGSGGTKDTGSNYANGVSSNGGAKSNYTSRANIVNAAKSGATTPEFGVGYIFNIAGEEKLIISQHVNASANGSGTAPERSKAVGKHVQTSAVDDIISFDNTGSGDYASNSNLIAIGSDLTPAAAVPFPISDLEAGTRLEITDTRKLYVASGDRSEALASTCVVIGDGGVYNAGWTCRDGDNSTAFGYTAVGGGVGSNGGSSICYAAGGSAGGSSSEHQVIYTGQQPLQSGKSGTYGYGKDGGTSTNHNNSYITSGGGGGAYEEGQSTTSASVSARGGDGIGGTNNTVVQTMLVDTCSGVLESDSLRYIAGGGGGGNVRAAGTAGAGGKGGGGDGCIDSGANADNGVANTGGGGGGGGNNVTHEGNGGSGLAIVRYLTSSGICATGGTKTTVGDYTYHKFTSDGTFTLVSGSGPYDLLLVAGGGAGNDAGGGAGGVVFRNGLNQSTSIWEEIGA